MWSCLRVPVKIQAAAFWTSWRLESRADTQIKTITVNKPWWNKMHGSLSRSQQMTKCSEFICFSNEKLLSKNTPRFFAKGVLDFSRGPRSTLREKRGSEGPNSSISFKRFNANHHLMSSRPSSKTFRESAEFVLSKSENHRLNSEMRFHVSWK